MKINMKENLKIINLLDMEYFYIQMEINIKENLKMVNLMDMEYYIV